MLELFFDSPMKEMKRTGSRLAKDPRRFAPAARAAANLEIESRK
jgi:hypothetical protein